MSDQEVTRVTEIRPSLDRDCRSPVGRDFIGKEGVRGQQLAPNTPMPIPAATAAPEVPPPVPPPTSQ